MENAKHYIKNILTHGYYSELENKFVSLKKATSYPSYSKARESKEINLKDIQEGLLNIVKLYH